MHIRHLRKVATKILGLQYMHADSQNYFIRKIQNLCKSVFRDCCIELEESADNVERAAASTNHAQYLIQSIDNRCPLPQEIKKRYQEVCSLFEQSTIKTFLIIVPYLIQNIKDIFVDKRMSEVPQNGLRGLTKETLDTFVSSARTAQGNNGFFELLSDSCNILQRLCMENYDKEPNSEIEKWGESLAMLSMLNYLKPFFQHCCQDIRLYKRLELFSCCLREIIADRDYVDEVLVRSSCNVSMSLIHFAKFDPSKVVRFELSVISTYIPCPFLHETIKHDKLENAYSQVFRIKNEGDELRLHAAASVCIDGEIVRKGKGTFQATITLRPSSEQVLNRYISSFHDISVTKLKDKGSGNLRVVFCTTQKEKLSPLLEVLRKELRENVFSWEVTQCPLSMRRKVTSREDTVLSLRLVYKWGSEAVCLDSKDFLAYDRSSHGQCVGKFIRFVILLVCPRWGTPGYKFGFRSSVQENVLPGEGRHEVWYRGTMFSQVISYDFPLHGPLHECFLYLAPAPPENPEGVANQELHLQCFLRCLKRFDHRRHFRSFVTLLLSLFKSIDDVGAGKSNQRNAHVAHKPKAVHGRFTLKDDCERQFWNEPFCELKERLNDVVHEQLMSKIYEQSVILIDDTMAEDLIVSCCTEANISVADECQMNPDVEKWTSVSEGSNNFAVLEDWLFLLIFPSI